MARWAIWELRSVTWPRFGSMQSSCSLCRLAARLGCLRSATTMTCCAIGGKLSGWGEVPDTGLQAVPGPHLVPKPGYRCGLSSTTDSQILWTIPTVPKHGFNSPRKFPCQGGLSPFYGQSTALANNGAEQALRVTKSRIKIPGGFQTWDRALCFICMRDLFEAAHKQGRDLLDPLQPDPIPP